LDETSFRPQLFIKPARFEQRLATIRRKGFQLLPLDDGLERLYAGTLPKDALVITVDDGFHTFSRLAVPLLLRHGCPATVYVTTYYVEHANPIFRLVVQYMFWKTQLRQVRLKDVPWGGDRFISLTDRPQVERVMWDCINFGERHCTEAQRAAICERLGTLLEVPYNEIAQSKILSLMSPDELRSLASANITVELHTHRHTFPADNRVAAEREIADNRRALARWLEGDKRHFCYPSGLYDERQWSWLDGLHVKSATTCVPGLNDLNTPRYALRRFLDGENIHQLEFEAALSGFSDLARGLQAQLSSVGQRLFHLFPGEHQHRNEVIR
jgi:peptidoglycan/xylan/chitin deacetylase (PgdA/CDA1 family)